MTYVVKTTQDVLEWVKRCFDEASSKEKGERQYKAHFHRGEKHAYNATLYFLENLVIGEVKFTDIKEITYKPGKGDWFKRLHRERLDTMHRVEALREFVSQGCPGPLMAEDKVLLMQQLTFMQAYLGILEIRWQRALVSRAADDLNEPPVGQAIPVDSTGMRDSHT